jgi:hypothetical protein
MDNIRGLYRIIPLSPRHSRNSPTPSFPKRFWSGIQLLTGRNHGSPIETFGDDAVVAFMF